MKNENKKEQMRVVWAKSGFSGIQSVVARISVLAQNLEIVRHRLNWEFL